MQTMTRSQLKAKLASLKACTAIAIETETEPKMLKKDRNTGEPNQFLEVGIVKIGTMAGLIGCSYENGVNNQLGREDKDLVFEAHERKWGELMDNKVMVVHTPKGHTTPKYYLQMLVKSSTKPIYTDGTQTVDVDELRGVLPKNDAPKTQDALDKKVILRDIALANIKVIRIQGEEYYVCNDEELVEMEKTEARVRNSGAIERVAEIFETL
jgi:hypothetical protein